MTSQALINQPASGESNPQGPSETNVAANPHDRFLETVRSLYPTIQQEEFLCLEARIELLLQELKAVP